MAISRRTRHARNDLTQEELKRHLRYSPETGDFTRLIAPHCHPHLAGTIAGGLNRGIGYVSITVNGHAYLAHRLAWLYVHGRWPAHQIDHINGIRNDNRLFNLREATVAQNQFNQRRSLANASGFKGVHWSRGRKKWLALIQVNKRPLFLGEFDDAQQAAQAYRSAAVEHYGEFARFE